MKEQWIIEQDNFNSVSEIEKFESLFTIGNGFLGLRGDLTIQNRAITRGTYINGFYEKGKIKYGEKAYGFADNWQTMIPVPDSKYIKIEVDGVELFTKNGFFTKNKRFLDMRNGTLNWEFTWKDDLHNQLFSGVLVTIVPFAENGTVLHHMDIELPKQGMEVSITSSIVLEIDKSGDEDDPRVSAHFNGSTLDVTSEGDSLFVHAKGSDLIAGCKMEHSIEGIITKENYSRVAANRVEKFWSGIADKTIQITKIASYSYGKYSDKTNILKNVDNELKEALDYGYSKIADYQQSYMNDFWQRSDVVIDGNEEAQLSLRYNLFQLLQSTGQDGKRSIAAKGLSGLGYEGHYFWDAEAYVLPFFIYTNPKIARSMLLYRISIMDTAEERAEILGHKGLLFPWRTINGEESSAYFPAGTAQYHINADIALGLSQYLDITDDRSILEDGGDKLLSGTADFWCSLADYSDGKGYCFNAVTGPDEYTALVDNNFFTNVMARENLLLSAKWLKDTVSEDDISRWLEVANNIYLPKDKRITPQDDNFLTKAKWDFDNTPMDKYPLLLNFHPLNIYRKQVLKQADVVMAQMLFRDEFKPGLMKRNFDYYEELTTRDSSLSACAQGINAFWLGYEDIGWEYFLETIHTDRQNIHNNVAHGLHTASMGGSYLMVLKGFLGVNSSYNTIGFRPKLPTQLKKIQINMMVKGSKLEISLTPDVISYLSVDADMTMYHFSDKIELKRGVSIELPTMPKLKLIVDSLQKKTKPEIEEEIWNVIENKNLLPEEVLVIARNKDERDFLNEIGYSSDLIKNSNYGSEFIKYRSSKRTFLGKRPKSKY